MFNVSGAPFDYAKGFCRSVAIVERGEFFFASLLKVREGGILMAMIENEFCYLKNGTGLNNTMGPSDQVASAVLIQDPTILLGTI